MEWVGIVGSRFDTNEKVASDVRKTVREIFNSGNGLVSGGAPGVDYIAVDEALKMDPEAERIRVIIPAPLDAYISYFDQMLANAPEMAPEIEKLILQLTMLNELSTLSSLPAENVNKKSFHERNMAIVDQVDRLVAFHVNDTRGTKNTINSALSRKKAVEVSSYHI